MKTAFLLTFGIMAGLGLTSAKADYRQSDEQFRAALMNGSTSQSFVLITAKDGRDGSIRTDCTLAPLLLGAIHREYELPFDKKGQQAALDIALAAKEHSFTFQHAEALANIPFDHTRFQRACEIIRSGQQAIMVDRSGEIVVGLPNAN